MPSPTPSVKYFRGPLLRSLDDEHADFQEDALLLVHAAGPSAGKIYAAGPAPAIAREQGLSLERFGKSPGLLLPAFFDTHFHWVQDRVRTMPKTSLIEWLDRYAFPEEARFADRAYAREEARRFWKRIHSVGTVGGLCYSSIHEQALEEALAHAPEDFRIGNVLMTMNCPDTLRQSEDEAARSVWNCARRFQQRYVCTPRFAPACGPAALKAAAEASRTHGCLIQTHLAETLSEIQWVLGIYREMEGFEDVRNYTEIYQRCGLLDARTVLGHCIHLSPEEWRLLARAGCRIASCPTSNAPLAENGLGSGLFDFKTAQNHGIPWALASDIGGGPFLSLFDVMRSFVAQNQTAEQNQPDRPSQATFVRALHRATRKGAEVMGLGADRGLLDNGYYFDAVRVPAAPDVLGKTDPEEILAALLEPFAGDRAGMDTFVEETWAKGTRVYSKEDPA